MTDVENSTDRIVRVKVVDVDIPFGSLVSLIVKLVLALIPAFILLALLAFAIGVFFGLWAV